MGHSYTSRGAPEPYEFELDGVTFTGTGAVSLLDVSELAHTGGKGLRSARGAAAIADAFVSALGDEEYDRFKAHCSEHGTEPEVLLQILADMAEDSMGGPTTRPGRSSPGPLTTSGMSVDASRLPVPELTPQEIQAWREGVRRAQASQEPQDSPG